MRKNVSSYHVTVLFGLLFLFFIQQLTTLVEAVYRYNLPDKEFGPATFALMAFAAPIYLFFVKKNVTSGGFLFLWMFLFLRCLIPWSSNPLLIVLAGLGVALFLNAFIIILSNRLGGNAGQLVSGMVLAVLLSISLRAFGSTLDISQTGWTVSFGYVLIVFAAVLLGHLQKNNIKVDYQTDANTNVSNVHKFYYMTGIFSGVGFIYFFMASPGVVARWTGADYLVINTVLPVSLMFLLFFLNSPAVINRIKTYQLISWNVLYLFILMLCIGLQMIDPPQSAEAELVIDQSPSLLQDVITYAMLLLSPVLFVNIYVFSQRIRGTSPRLLARPALISTLILLIATLLLLFSNIWGYLGVLGHLFRQGFYLPFLILMAGIILPLMSLKMPVSTDTARPAARPYLMLSGIILCALTIIGILSTAANPPERVAAKKYIICMTFNLQQGTDLSGNQSYTAQLSAIKRINPDILCLQESDVARISGGNNDIVRYLADKLNYYSFYGPKTVTGTFGTAILSRFPLSGCRSIFTYSDKDEVGTAVCTVIINGERVLLVNNHPAGSDSAKQAHLDMLFRLSQTNKRIIALGDFNFERSSRFYRQITSTLFDSGAREDTLRISRQIDYIFLSKNFKVTGNEVIPSPESASDHPAYSSVIEFIKVPPQ